MIRKVVCFSKSNAMATKSLFVLVREGITTLHRFHPQNPLFIDTTNVNQKTPGKFN